MNDAPKFELSIIGLGYVGLPLGLQIAKPGCCPPHKSNLLKFL
jgi:UDP-N-acetyl-D-mannosaminuronate dehydrogenase